MAGLGAVRPVAEALDAADLVAAKGLSSPTFPPWAAEAASPPTTTSVGALGAPPRKEGIPRGPPSIAALAVCEGRAQGRTDLHEDRERRRERERERGRDRKGKEVCVCERGHRSGLGVAVGMGVGGRSWGGCAALGRVDRGAHSPAPSDPPARAAGWMRTRRWCPRSW